MSDLKKLIEGLPIKIVSQQVSFVDPRETYIQSREQVIAHCEGKHSPRVIGWRVILALMDEAEEKPDFKVGDWFQTESVTRQMVAIANKKGWIEGNDGMIYDPICCRHVPPPKEVMPSESSSTEEDRSAVTGAHRAVKTSEIEKELQIVAAELDSCRNQLQSARELAEYFAKWLVDIRQHFRNLGMATAETEVAILQARAREVLEKIK